MPIIESLKCPNCGAAVKGSGLLVCPYCGSQLRVEGEARAEAPFAPEVARLDKEVHFRALPSLTVTAETTDIPFKPEISYVNLPGARLDPSLRSDADRILSLVEMCQRAINTEDLDLYMSTIAKESSKFYDMARDGAEAQFVTSDMKRFTTKVDFLSLTEDAADVAVSFEAFIFPSQKSDKPNVIVVNVTQHMEVTFDWRLKKIAGRWKVVGAGLKRKKVVLSGVQWVFLILTVGGPAVGILVGLGVACWAIFGSMFMAAYENISGTTVGEPETIEVPVTGEGLLEDRTFVADEPITVYEDRDASSPVEYVIAPGTEFEVKKDKEGWAWIWVDREGAVGWAPSVEVTGKSKEVVTAGEGKTSPDEFIVESGLVIYDEPDFSADPKYVIMPGAKVTVVKRKGDWAYVRT
ncbi:MAG: hypothetical protein JSW52_02870, partial [Candidatus Coatesbacteria bacterium]